MSSSGTESKVSISRPEPDVRREAQDIFRLLANLGRWSLSKVHSITLQDNSKLVLRMWRFRIRTGWKIILDDFETTCPQCRKRARAIKRTFRQEAPPTSEELAGWMADMIQHHSEFHREASAETTETPAPASKIKLKGSDEKGTARIKILSPKDESSKSRQTPGRIKVGENPTAITSPPPEKGEDKRLALSRPRTDETVRIIPLMEYRLSGGVGVEIFIPVGVCDDLIDHCRLSLEHGSEVGGVMVGIKDEVRGASGNVERYRVRVTDLIHFRAADSSGSRLHLTSDSWAHVSVEETRCGYEEQSKVRLGWYHTHPTQGIFFSRYDRDFHTVFSKLFQFAIVVDPRNMEAGLFYWDDPERRSLIGPTNFFLGPRQAPIHSATAIAVYDGTSVLKPKRGKLAPVRVLFLVVPVLLLVLYTLADARSLFLDPNQIIILSFIPLFALSLWNIEWFHPLEPLEVRMLTQLQQLIDRQARTGETTSTSSVVRKLVIFAALTLLLLLIILNVPAVRSRIWPRPSSNATETHSTNVPGTQVEGNKSSAERVELTLRSANAGEMILEADDGRVKVRYEKQGSSWSCDKQEERDFFAHLFQWDINEQDEQSYIRDLQTRLDSNSTDGLWGQNTRRLFLDRIKSLAKANATIGLRAPNNKTFTVSVIDHSEENSVSSPPDVHPSRPQTPPKPKPSARPKADATPKPNTSPATSVPAGRDSTTKPKPSESPTGKREPKRDPRD